MNPPFRRPPTAMFPVTKRTWGQRGWDKRRVIVPGPQSHLADCSPGSAGVGVGERVFGGRHVGDRRRGQPDGKDLQGVQNCSEFAPFPRDSRATALDVLQNERHPVAVIV